MRFLFSPQLTSKNLRWFPFFLIIYSFAGNVSNDIYMPSMPALVGIFHTSKSLIQLTLTLWFLGAAIPQLLFGPIADRYGRRVLLFIGGIIFLGATLACGLTTHITILAIGRFFQGVGVCSLTIISFAVIRELYHDHQCVHWLSMISMCNSSAPLIGPLIGGYIFILLNWQTNFHLVFFLALLGLSGLWFFMPESKTELNTDALNPSVLIKNYFDLMKNKHFMKDVLSFGILFGGMIAYLTGAPFILIGQLRLAPQNFGYTQLVVFSLFMLAASLVGIICRHYGSKKTIIIGMSLILFASTIMVISSLLLPSNLYTFVGSMAIYGFGFGLASSPLAKDALSATKQAGGFSAALLGFSMTGFSSLASFAVSLFYNGSIMSVAVTILVIVCFAWIIYILLRRPKY